MAIVRKQSFGPCWICWVDADPSGVTTAPIGTLALALDGSAAWRNTDGATAWSLVAPAASLPTWDLDGMLEAYLNQAGNYTFACHFVVRETQSMTGLKFVWAGASKTVRCSLWNITGASRATYVDVVTGAGPVAVTATFAAAQTLSAGVTYAASLWDTSTALYQPVTYATAGSTLLQPFWLPPYHVSYTRNRQYGVGDAIPTSTSTDWYAVTPVLA